MKIEFKRETYNSGAFKASMDGREFKSGNYYLTPNGFWAEWGKTGKLETHTTDINRFKKSLTKAMNYQLKYNDSKIKNI